MRWGTRRTALVMGALAIFSLSTLAAGRSPARHPTQGARKAKHAFPAAQEKIDPVPHRAEAVIPKEPGWRGTIFKGFEDVARPVRPALINALARQGAPAQRLAAFHKLDQPNIRLDGWIAKLTSIDAARDTVTLQVTPLITLAGGGSTTVLASLEETYRFHGGLLTLVDARLEGMMAMIID